MRIETHCPINRATTLLHRLGVGVVRKIGKTTLLKDCKEIPLGLGMQTTQFLFFRSITGINNPHRLETKFGLPRKPRFPRILLVEGEIEIQKLNDGVKC